jgi:hypothetical protein
MTEKSELKVFISSRESRCDACGEPLGSGAWITLAGEHAARCLACAEIEHLVFLPSGDAALTRRARQQSTLSAIVLKWSKARKRYERQGVLVEEAALIAAESACLKDEDARARRRVREAERRAALDRDYVERFSQRIRELFPACPPDIDQRIAEHACLRYSGRVGRTAAAKALDETAIRLAVVAHARHTETRYDELLAGGLDRQEARRRVEPLVHGVLAAWQRAVRADPTG